MSVPYEVSPSSMFVNNASIVYHRMEILTCCTEPDKDRK